MKSPKELGAEAFRNGNPCIPYLDDKLQDIIHHLPPFSGEISKVLDEWIQGWTRENLK